MKNSRGAKSTKYGSDFLKRRFRRRKGSFLPILSKILRGRSLILPPRSKSRGAAAPFVPQGTCRPPGPGGAVAPIKRGAAGLGAEWNGRVVEEAVDDL